MNLKQIFESITPDNIKSIPLIADAINIFIENLEEHSKISIDIKEIYNSDNDEIRKALLETYLSTLYGVLNNVQNNQVVKDKIDNIQTMNLDLIIPIKYNVPDVLSDEYLSTNKSFKQKVGTETGVEYAYNFGKYLQTNENTDLDFKLIEKTLYGPFHFETQGSILKEIYENVVKPISHPLGWTYTYSQVIKESLSDFYGLVAVPEGTSIEVRCLSGYYDVYTKDSDDINIKADFLTRKNYLTGELFTEEEYYKYVTIITNKNVTSLEVTEVENSYKTSILFDDDTVLEQYTNPIRVYYRTLQDELDGNNKYIKQYDGHCSLYYDYLIDYNTTYTDDIEKFIVELDITAIKDYDSNSDEQFYFETSNQNAFHVGGETYTYVPGQDEGATTTGEASTADYVNVSIAELRDGSYTNADTLVNGLYTEGEDYEHDYLSPELVEEETFIGIGRKLYPINTSDYVIMTSTDYVQDEILIYSLNSNGYYLHSGDDTMGPSDPSIIGNTYTDPDDGTIININGDFYLYTTDGWYLRAEPNN